MKRIAWLVLPALLSLPAYAKLKVGATTSDMEALVKAVGGDQVETFAIAKGTQDPHQIEAKPSFMVKFRDADLVVSQGLELESAWLGPLLRGARNTRIVEGTSGFLALGPGVDPLEVAKGDVSRAEGDVHPGGNPHFQLDPVRLGKAALAVSERLGALDPSHKDFFHVNARKFQARMEEKAKEWKSRIEKSGVREFVSHHKTFTYFANRFGLKNSLQLEPRPGIPPTSGHILGVIQEMKARQVRLVLIENYFDDAVRGKLEGEIPGLQVVKVPVSVGGDPAIMTNEDLLEKLVKTVEGAAK